MGAVPSITADDCISVSPAKNCRLILTAPHGAMGSFHPKLFIERKGQGILTKPDLFTIDMLQEIEEKMLKLSNKSVKPYTIWLKVQRKYIDANRSKKHSAYRITDDNEFGKTVYDLYHAKIQQAIREIEAVYGKGSAILIDIHGQIKMRDHLMIGNKNGKTCGYVQDDTDDNNKYKKILHNILAHALNSKDENINVYGWNEKQNIFTGGYTVQKHSGYLNDERFERMAIQFEFGRNLRENRNTIVDLLSKGLYDISVDLSESIDDIRQHEFMKKA